MKITCDEYINHIKISKRFAKKHSSMDLHITDCSTENIERFLKQTPAFPLIGNSRFAPTGEAYEKISIRCDTAKEAEGCLLYFLKKYISDGKSNGKKYLYWRRMPYLSFFRDHRWNNNGKCFFSKKYYWYGRCRLLMSNKKNKNKQKGK